MGRRIFISYRREDAAVWAGLLHDRLDRDLRKPQLFMDVVSLEPGRDFVKAISESVAVCEVLLCIIGQGWVSARDAKGKRRLDDARDFVRLEVASGLQRERITVIPVLIDGAPMPREDQLPADLKPLARRNAIEITHGKLDADMARLVDAIEGRAASAGSGKRVSLAHDLFLGLAMLVLGIMGPLGIASSSFAADLGANIAVKLALSAAVVLAILAYGLGIGYRGMVTKLLAAVAAGWAAFSSAADTTELQAAEVNTVRHAAEQLGHLSANPAIPVAAGLVVLAVTLYLLLRAGAERR